MRADALNLNRSAPETGHHRKSVVRSVFRVFLALGAMTICWQVAAARLAEFDGATFWTHFHDVTVTMVLLSIVATAISFAAISCYDLIAFRALGTNAPAGQILRSGAAATAIGQLVGFGLIIGAFTRWRMLRKSGVGQVTAAGASAIVTVGFLFGLSILAGFFALVLPNDVAAMIDISAETVSLIGYASIGLFGAVLLIGTLGRSVHLFGRPFTPPRTRTLLAQVGLAGVDVLFAATALWLVTPAAVGVEYGTLIIAYVGVLAICLLANAPGGVGPLEASLLFALPAAPAEPLIAGIITFRLIYYVLPGALALLLLLDTETGHRAANALRRLIANPSKPANTPLSLNSQSLQRALRRSCRAECQLALLGDKLFLPSSDRRAFLMYRRSGRAIIALGDPIGAQDSFADLCTRFLKLAATLHVTPVFYKANSVMAYSARQNGLAVSRVGKEAVIELSSFTIAEPARREVRRKVRRAAKAGVTILAHAPGEAPLETYAQIASEWLASRPGAEAGFSMGRYDCGYLRHFPIYEAQVAGHPVAFISIWRSGDGTEWSVDVMRHANNAPSGTMQALIVAACDGARAAGAKSFNLCLSPLSGLSPPQNTFERVAGLIYRRGSRLHSLQGLHRFKTSFRPTWSPRYIARAKGLSGLYGLWAVRRLIVAPTGPPASRSVTGTSISDLAAPAAQKTTWSGTESMLPGNGEDVGKPAFVPGEHPQPEDNKTPIARSA